MFRPTFFTQVESHLGVERIHHYSYVIPESVRYFQYKMEIVHHALADPLALVPKFNLCHIMHPIHWNHI